MAILPTIYSLANSDNMSLPKPDNTEHVVQTSLFEVGFCPERTADLTCAGPYTLMTLCPLRLARQKCTPTS
jgi:hypothetical protein